jgi:hypothetical protein
LDISGSRSETPGKFLNVVLEKDGEDQLKLGRFWQYTRNTWKVLKCGAGEGWRRSIKTWTLLAVHQKHLESFEMWCWRRMEKIN